MHFNFLDARYRLLASSFLEKNIAVAIVGHRMYPDANVTEQVQDLSTALRVLLRTNTCLFIRNTSTYNAAFCSHTYEYRHAVR